MNDVNDILAEMNEKYAEKNSSEGSEKLNEEYLI